MRTILITGITGFVGGHLVNRILDREYPVAIHGISRTQPGCDFFQNNSCVADSVKFHIGDLTDYSWVQQCINDIKPDSVIHLAAQSSVADSWRTPRETVLNNVTGFLNVIESIRKSRIDSHILSVGSAEVYGKVNMQNLPITENHPLMPLNPYAAARITQEDLTRIYSGSFALSINTTRSFNHIGPGQDTRFVASSIAKQFAEIAKGKREPKILTGDSSIIRDFLDVRDVADAYLMILQNGKPGEVYNVCSGKGRKISELVSTLSDITGISVISEELDQLKRPQDNPVLVGSNAKIRMELGWQPKISFESTMKEIFNYWFVRV